MSHTTARALSERRDFPARNSAKQGVIRNPADRAQVALAVAGPLVLVFPFFVSLTLWLEVLLWFAVWFFLCRHNYILHNHVHCPFTRSRTLNRVIGIMLGFCTGMTAGIWKITHVHGHHVEHKIESLPTRAYVRHLKVDESARFSSLTAAIHAIKTAPIQLLLPVYVMATRSFTGAAFRRPFYRFYLFEFLLVYGLVGVFVWINPVKAIFYFGLMYALVYHASRYVDFVTHASSEGPSELSIANVCIHPRFNKTFWNFGFHVAHHLNPGAHWTELPALYKNLGIEEDSSVVAARPNILGAFGPATFSWHRVRQRRVLS